MWMVFFGGVAEGDWDRKNGRMLVCVLGNGRMLVCVLRWDFESRRMFKSMRSLYGERTLSIAPGFNPVMPTKRIPLSKQLISPPCRFATSLLSSLSIGGIQPVYTWFSLESDPADVALVSPQTPLIPLYNPLTCRRI